MVPTRQKENFKRIEDGLVHETDHDKVDESRKKIETKAS